MSKWKYKVVDRRKEFLRSEIDLEKLLNKMSNDGWQLTTNDGDLNILIFKKITIEE
jgi:hypothetical protein